MLKAKAMNEPRLSATYCNYDERVLVFLFLDAGVAMNKAD